MSNSTFPVNAARAKKARSFVFQAYAKDFLDLIVRRKWLISVCVLLGIVVGGGLAWMKKDAYRSSTVILVEQQNFSPNYVPSVVGGSAAERVSRTTQQVLSRTNLKKVIDEFHLFPEVINTQGYEPGIGGLRNTINIETIGRGGQLEAFTISFAHHDPMMAMKVTAKLGSQYIDENIKIRERFNEGAAEFLEKELASSKAVLDAKEKELSEYKLRYLGELPGQLESNLRTLDRLQLEKIRIQDALNELNPRLHNLQETIREYESSLTAMRDGDGSVPSGVMAKGEMVSSVRQIMELKEELSQLSREDTEANPGIVSLMIKIGELEEELAKGLNTKNKADRQPFYLHLAELINSRKAIEIQITKMISQLDRVSRAMKKVERRVERTPHREQELLGLERDYENIQENYQYLHQKRINARISENLDTRQQGERFRILDPANLPITPEGWPREVIALGGLGVGAGLGFGLAFLLDFLSPTFRRSEDAEVSLGVPMLATIPSFHMAYGKSMKMLSGITESPAGGNGQSNTRGFSHYVDMEAMGKNKSLSYRLSSKSPTFPAQFDLVSKWRPQSMVAEQFRVAATRLDLLGDRSMGNVVLVSSAMKGEGKTSTAANLAYTLARDLDEPTLVIDCDYKCPHLHNVFVFNQYPGVADYLAGEVPLESCFQQVQDLPLWCMAAGDMDSNPVSLSKLQHLSSLIESVRSRYRFILLDGPPILPLADINILGRLTDIVLMVVRSGTTPKDVVQKAIEMLQGSHSTRLILTDAWSQGVPHYARAGSMPLPVLNEPGLS